MTEVDHYQKAIESLRRAGGRDERRESLRHDLREAQSGTMDEMGVIAAETEVGDAFEKAREHVQGKPLQDALLALALGADVPQKGELRERVEELAEAFPMQYMIQKTIVDESGEAVATRPPLRTGSEEDQEKAMRAEMFQQASKDHDAIAQLFVEPARQQIYREYPVTFFDFLPLLYNNPFVPPGRVSLFAKGLTHGLRGDYVEALHLLIPQLETSFRHILSQLGVVVSSLDDEGVQQKMDLNTMLWEHEDQLDEVLGEDIVFDLQGLLASPLGTNLRNRLAHGLIAGQALLNRKSAYAWWLCLKLCLMPVAAHLQKEAKQPGTAGPHGARPKLAGSDDTD